MVFTLPVALQKKEVACVVIPSSRFAEKKIGLLRFLTERRKKICYVNFCEPLDRILAKLDAEGISIEKMLFIDTVTTNTKENEHNQSIYIGSPKSLTNLSLTIQKVFDTQKMDVLFFDSVSTMLIHNSVGIATRFIHDFITKARQAGIQTFLLASGGTNEQIMGDIKMFVDHTMHVGEETNDKKNSTHR